MSSKAFVRIAAVPYVVWMAIFVIVPLLFIVGYAFTNSSGALTLENFSNLGVYAPVFKNSFLQAGVDEFLAAHLCLDDHSGKQRFSQSVFPQHRLN